MPIGNLFKISQYNRNKFCTRIIDASAPSADYYFLVVLSTLIVALGLLADNIILVIGGMLVTPLLSPILAVALGVVINERKVLSRSLKIFLISIGSVISVSFITGLISTVSLSDLEIINKMHPSLITILIAIVAGLAASYNWVKPNLNDTLPGIAVTVTIIPPLTAIGLSLAYLDWKILKDVFNVFFLNIIGIILASLLVFSLMEFYKARRKAIEEIKEEEKIIKEQIKKKEKKTEEEAAKIDKGKNKA